MSYYIKRRVGAKTRYWDGKGWNPNEAKGYTSEKRALNAARGLVKNAKGFSDELSIEITA